MSLDDIDTLAGRFESATELAEYCNKQYQMIERLREENLNLKAEVSHLKDLVTATAPLIGVPEAVKITVSKEQSICEAQIHKLQEKAYNRELTLEETKRLEILVKSLYLIREKTSGDIEAQFNKVPTSLSIESLAQIATSSEETTDGSTS